MQVARTESSLSRVEAGGSGTRGREKKKGRWRRSWMVFTRKGGARCIKWRGRQDLRDRNFEWGGGEIHRFYLLLATLRGEKINAVEAPGLYQDLRSQVKNERFLLHESPEETNPLSPSRPPHLYLPRNYTPARLMIAPVRRSLSLAVIPATKYVECIASCFLPDN